MINVGDRKINVISSTVFADPHTTQILRRIHLKSFRLHLTFSIKKKKKKLNTILTK